MIEAACILLALGTVLFTLLVHGGAATEQAGPSETEVMDERRRLLRDNLEDLEFEHYMGKLSSADLAEARKSIESELTALSAEAASRPAEHATAGTACPHCGARFEKPLNFCGECGKPMYTRGAV
jgi:hypothetical protein